jgi:ABC-type lipoprotein release transport system permease subunit
MSDRWGVGEHLGSKLKSRKLQQIDFFTSSSPQVARPQVSPSFLADRSSCSQCVALVASVLPARRAASVNPVQMSC